MHFDTSKLLDQVSSVLLQYVDDQGQLTHVGLRKLDKEGWQLVDENTSTLDDDLIADFGGYFRLAFTNYKSEDVPLFVDAINVSITTPGKASTIVYEGLQVLQRDDYYPFGVTFNSYAQAPENLYKFQGPEEETETGWIQFKWRNHDPALGRFFNVDPLSEKFYYNSPYAFSENKREKRFYFHFRI